MPVTTATEKARRTLYGKKKQAEGERRGRRGVKTEIQLALRP